MKTLKIAKSVIGLGFIAATLPSFAADVVNTSVIATTGNRYGNPMCHHNCRFL